MPQSSQKINKLLDKVEEVIEEQKKLEKKEEVILAAVATDEKTDEQIETAVSQEMSKVETVTKQITDTTSFRKSLAAHLQRHEFIFPVVIITGVVLVWKGLWGIFDQLPIVSYSVISLLLGLTILWVFNRVKSL